MSHRHRAKRSVVTGPWPAVFIGSALMWVAMALFGGLAVVMSVLGLTVAVVIADLVVAWARLRKKAKRGRTHA